MSASFQVPHPRVLAASAGRWTRARYGAAREHTRAVMADPARRRRAGLTALIWTAVALAVVAFFWFFQWDWMRGPLSAYASAQTGRRVRIEGHLDVHPFHLQPYATVRGLKVGNPRWAGPGDAFDLGQTTVKVKLLPLLIGRTEFPLIRIEHPTVALVQDKTGRNNWTIGRPTSKPAALPPIQRFILTDGKLTVDDQKRHLVFHGTVSTEENAITGTGGGFRMEGEGSLNRAPFTMHISGAPLINVRRDRPYPFNADVRAGSSHIVAHGQVARPFDFGKLDAAIDASGTDLANLYSLTGVVLPNTPPYRLTADFVRDGGKFTFHRLGGRVGDSDLEGELEVDKTSARPFLRADLVSRRLDFDDVNALIGGAPAAGKGQTISPQQQAVAAKMKADKRLLPDSPLYADRVRSMDADVRYSAKSIHGAMIPLRTASLHLTLDHGLLVLDPLTFTLPHGDATGSVRLDARPATPVTDLDMRLTNVRLEDLTPKLNGAPVMEGLIVARARLHGAGDSVHKAAAASNGQIAIAVPGGQMRKSLAELLGVNLVPGLFELLGKDTDPTPLRCAVANFQVTNGKMLARDLVLDTNVVKVEGSGTIDLDTEALHLEMRGKSKKVRIGHVIAPFDIKGHLAAPSFRVEPGAAIAQAGIGVALSTVATPLAAIIPFLSLGGAHNAPCGELLADSRQAGAPVKNAQIAAGAAKK